MNPCGCFRACGSSEEANRVSNQCLRLLFGCMLKVWFLYVANLCLGMFCFFVFDYFACKNVFVGEDCFLIFYFYLCKISKWSCKLTHVN